jgi:hypothetical protein
MATAHTGVTVAHLGYELALICQKHGMMTPNGQDTRAFNLHDLIAISGTQQDVQ